MTAPCRGWAAARAEAIYRNGDRSEISRRETGENVVPRTHTAEMESVDLGATPHTVQRWWARGSPGELGHAVIGLGRLQAGPWFVAKAEHGTNMAWLARDERHARGVAAQGIL